ncbi:hypothetical protein KI387_012229, partial [Taxus chinensis]
MDISPMVLTLGLGFLLLAVFLLKKKPSSGINLPPGSFGWPLLGESLEFLASQRDNACYDFMEKRVKKYGDTFKTHFLGAPMAVFYSPAGNRFLFSNENKLVQTSWPSSLAKLFGNSILTKVGDEAKDLRKTLLTFLRPEALQNFVGRADTIIRDHLTRYWVGKEEVKTFPLAKRCLFTVACALFVSLGEGPEQDELYDHFMDLINGMLQIPVDLPGTLYRKSRIGSNHIRRILQSVIDKRREDLASGLASSDQDLLSYLLCNVDGRENPLSDSDINDNIMQLLMAGHDTNAVAVTLLLKYLALNPHCYRQVLQEQLNITRENGEKQLQWDDIQRMKYTWNAAQETLRLNPPAGGTWRKAIVEISYGGFTIPKGWKLFWTANSTHKNPKYFPDPDKFEP